MSDLRIPREAREWAQDWLLSAELAAKGEHRPGLPRTSARFVRDKIARTLAEQEAIKQTPKSLDIIRRALRKAERFARLEAERYAREDAAKAAEIEADRARADERYANDPAFRAAVNRERIRHGRM